MSAGPLAIPAEFEQEQFPESDRTACSQGSKEREVWQRSTGAERTIALFTAIPSFVAIGQGVIMVKSLRQTEKQIGQTQQSIEMARTEQRAWLGVANPQPVQDRLNEGSFPIVVRITNTGKTPAHIGGMYFLAKVYEGREIPVNHIRGMQSLAFDLAYFHENTFGNIFSDRSIAPGVEAEDTTSVILTADDVAHIRSGDSKLCVAGYLGYFAHGEPREGRIAVASDPPYTTNPPHLTLISYIFDPSTGRFFATRDGNSMN